MEEEEVQLESGRMRKTRLGRVRGEEGVSPGRGLQTPQNFAHGKGAEEERLSHHYENWEGGTGELFCVVALWQVEAVCWLIGRTKLEQEVGVGRGYVLGCRLLTTAFYAASFSSEEDPVLLRLRKRARWNCQLSAACTAGEGAASMTDSTSCCC